MKRPSPARPWRKPLRRCAARMPGATSSNPRRRDLPKRRAKAFRANLAVGHVIANRANSPIPSELLRGGLPAQSVQLRRGRSMPHIPRASRDWQEAVAIAKIVDDELHPSPMGKALFFHARRSFAWLEAEIGVGTLGNHVFYR